MSLPPIPDGILPSIIKRKSNIRRKCSTLKRPIKKWPQNSRTKEKLDQLLKLPERNCVVYQTIKGGPPVGVKMQVSR